MTMLLRDGRVVTPEGVLDDGWVAVDGERIAAVGSGPAPEEHTRGEVVDLAGQWVVPGFVDIHCHGGGGASFGSADPEQVIAAVAAHRAHGTTTMLASLVTEPIPELARQVAVLAELAEDGVVAGVHLEGPFLAAARCGAHDPALLRPPARDDVRTLLDAGRGAVRMCTLAPELDNAVEAVRQLVDHGVIAAVGHTDATEAQVRPAVDAGATVATHLFNGMRPLHHREPGPIGALLDDERVTVELICDLVHLAPTVVRLAARHAGAGRTVLVTDAISATGAGDGSYRLGDLEVTVRGGEPRLADGSLAGSTLTMDAAFRNLVRSCGLSVVDAAWASATRPAALLGLAERTGAVRAGLAADLVVLDADLRPTQVLHRGAPVPRP
ncbi:N-acetylglucosamine 6-phosphate deacetylase (EC 3.5.1.25) [Streptoalloteichus tenebrarius]|uniref:N-acetylglucosamine 6-phosphate deacetylase n=1 Tax=Streptoalloteichus tenebrarius (strain ATCC 17920 / DSM 40477 / JCM 4838 / CBS 697.72 / NBRC 16177 / NCIMB 11028 / NRRL B-12390 / A12253. 1 / ISP 5477) TaxID=1933 RepID=A0ABT1I3F7_STRSD|nr:N-acetylglucosamine-6-phosphate deacetylase [Streptoalloteichus tenebrarius]MCP2262326.1 N-acetylglucosamine 6-phosphate deacetylase (EC 3.5.1.25) [Streptoalloteichus tenebrarius]BFF02220.1 N-acetylglucosamine-6-phosphate deacetylase [Streptoalloteichus tenebrarius]